MRTKFEQSFFAGFKYWVREYDPELQASNIRELPTEWECYEPDDNGKYRDVYKPEIRYRKSFGKSQFARQRVSPINPTDLIIREQFNGKGRYNNKPRIMYLDIETHVGTVSTGFPVPDKALEPVSLIQFLDSKTDVVHIIGDRDFYYKEWYLKQPDHLNHEVKYHKCNNEYEMFEKFFGFIQSMKPAIVYAWNGSGFDFPYLYNRAKRLNMNVNKFSPWQGEFGGDIVEGRETIFMDQYEFSLTAAGIHYIDIKRLYRKISLGPQPSYSLNAIATVELKARKISHDEFKGFEDFYLGNYRKPENPTEDETKTLCYQMTLEGKSYEEIQKAGHGQFVYYGVIDVVLLKGIDNKVGLTKLMISIAERMNSQLDAVLGTTKIWANAIRNRLYQENVVINPNNIAADIDKKIEGGFVREPVSGKQEWVISADVNSMYPILAMLGINMSPDTFTFARDLELPELKEFAITELKVGTINEQNETNMLKIVKNPAKAEKLKVLLQHANMSMAPNGTFYKKDHKGIVPIMVEEIYHGRKAAKKQMIQHDKKLQLVLAELRKRKKS